MKQLIKLPVMACTLLMLTACNKDGSKIPAPAVVGTWNLVSDSGFSGIGPNNQPFSYRGQPGDYFDFRTNGRLYIKEGASADTTDYQLLSDSTLRIGGVGIVLNGLQALSKIENLTAHTLTLSATAVLTPCGAFDRHIHLSR